MRHKRLCWARREEAAAECEKKKKGGKGDKERSEQRREEGDYLHKKKNSSLKFCWVTGRVKLQTGLSFLLLSLSSPTSGEPRHTACVPTPPPPSPPNTHLRTQHNPRERKSDGGRKTGWGILLTPQPSRGVGHAFVTRTHKKIKNKADRRKQEEKKKEKSCIYLKLQQQMGGPLCSRGDVYLTSHPGSDEHHITNGPHVVASCQEERQKEEGVMSF